MMVGVEFGWVGGLEGNLGGVCRMGFKYPFVVSVDFLGTVGIMPGLQGDFDAI